MLTATVVLSGCKLSQVSYEKTQTADRWVFDYTGVEMLMWTLAGADLIVLGEKDLDPTDDDLSW